MSIVYDIEVPKLQVDRVKSINMKGDLVLFNPLFVPDMGKTSSGLEIAQEEEEDGDIMSAKYPMKYGQVIDVGPDVTRCKPGDYIMFHKYSGQDGDLIEHKVMVLRNNEVWACPELEVSPYMDSDETNAIEKESTIETKDEWDLSPNK